MTRTHQVHALACRNSRCNHLARTPPAWNCKDRSVHASMPSCRYRPGQFPAKGPSRSQFRSVPIDGDAAAAAAEIPSWIFQPSSLSGAVRQPGLVASRFNTAFVAFLAGPGPSTQGYGFPWGWIRSHSKAHEANQDHAIIFHGARHLLFWSIGSLLVRPSIGWGLRLPGE